MPLTQILEASGDGSGFQEGHNELKQGIAPSVSLLEENMIGQELDEKRAWEDTWFHFAPPLPQRQIQIMDGDGSPEIIEAQSQNTVSPTIPKQATSTQSVPTTTSTLSQVRSVSSNWQRATGAITTAQKEATTKTLTDLPSLNGKGGDNSIVTNTAQGQGTDVVPRLSENVTPGGATVLADQEANPQLTPADSSITTKPQFSHPQNSDDVVIQTVQSNQTGN